MPAAEPLVGRGSAGVAGGWVASCTTDAAQPRFTLHLEVEAVEGLKSRLPLLQTTEAIEHAWAGRQVGADKAAGAAAH